MPSFQIQARLGGHPSTGGILVATNRTRSQRVTRAVIAMGFFLALGAGVVFIPPHFPWAIGSLAAGIFVSMKQWRAAYIVERFSGTCPRCGTELSIPSGEAVGFPMTVSCFGCHHEPVLSLAQLAS